MASYDLTSTIGTYLERHLVFPLLEFLQLKQIYPENEILQAKIELLSKTNMVDFAKDIYKKLHQTEEIPAEMDKRRDTIVAKLKELQTDVTPVLQFLEQHQAVIKQLCEDKQFATEFLEENKNEIKPEQIEVLYRFAKFQFDCGNYSASAEFLSIYRALSNPASERSFQALWGKFAAEILMQDWESALADMNLLREAIETKTFPSQLHQLQQRTWLIHWSLFVFFNHPNGRNGIIDLFFQENYLNTIQATCPHVLRYLTTAVITNKRRRSVLKDLVKVLQQEQYNYKDPITEFLDCLYVNFDFEGAQQKLRECENVLANDFFLVACRDEFLENARLFIFETYCRIHQCIDIGMLAEKLNMDQEAAERWIVNLIRNAKLDAKIDSAAGHVIMGTQYPSIYQQVIEKTKVLPFRTYYIANQIEKRQSQQSTKYSSDAVGDDD